MSGHADEESFTGLDTSEHQLTFMLPSYLYLPIHDAEEPSSRPSKKRKTAEYKCQDLIAKTEKVGYQFSFGPLLNGLESPQCVAIRQKLYQRTWMATEARVQSILDDANEDILNAVSGFVDSVKQLEDDNLLPTGFIVTGSNTTSQGLVFSQLSARLQAESGNTVVLLRSGDAPNLKAILKKLVRDATNQRSNIHHEDESLLVENGRKLLSYDLKILHNFVRKHGSDAVIVAFQDTEGFDTKLIADLINLFCSWRDRIPFVLFFGIATSVDLFHERLSRSASRCLHGVQFDVEQADSLLERIFQKAVAGSEALLLIGTALISALMERQEDHAHIVQSFVAALKYAYMCHFYADALSILLLEDSKLLSQILSPQHYEAIRTLPSYRKLVEARLESGDLTGARKLLENDNDALLGEVQQSRAYRAASIIRILRVMHVLACVSPEPVSKIALYVAAFDGLLSESNIVTRTLESLKRMMPEEVVVFIKTLTGSIEQGSVEMDLAGWAKDDIDFLQELDDLQAQASGLAEEASRSGVPVRSSYTIHSNGIRTTVIAQRVQLSYAESKLTDQDKKFTCLVDKLSEIMKEYFLIHKPQDIFLSETWIYNSASPYRDVFTPRPRAAIERALSRPYDYLACKCCEPVEGLSSTHPATATLYQMYLETGSLVNIFDLWQAFYEMVGEGDEDKLDERDALVMFYRALADLKSLGMVKQSKKKVDHLAKVLWKGL